jgi:hypothetical protein
MNWTLADEHFATARSSGSSGIVVCVEGVILKRGGAEFRAVSAFNEIFAGASDEMR